MTDLENLRVQQRLADVGDPSKVRRNSVHSMVHTMGHACDYFASFPQINILYIFKQYGWANFVKEFKSFLRSLHVEVINGLLTAGPFPLMGAVFFVGEKTL